MPFDLHTIDLSVCDNTKVPESEEKPFKATLVADHQLWNQALIFNQNVQMFVYVVMRAPFNHMHTISDAMNRMHY